MSQVASVTRLAPSLAQRLLQDCQYRVDIAIDTFFANPQMFSLDGGYGRKAAAPVLDKRKLNALFDTYRGKQCIASTSSIPSLSLWCF